MRRAAAIRSALAHLLAHQQKIEFEAKAKRDAKHGKLAAGQSPIPCPACGDIGLNDATIDVMRNTET
jgi:hypothetical protein